MPEPKHSETRHEPMRIGLLGASFDTGNMGVSALAESSIKVILNRWPDAEVILLGSGRTPDEHLLKINDRELHIKTVPIRFCKNLFLAKLFAITARSIPARSFDIKKLKYEFKFIASFEVFAIFTIDEIVCKKLVFIFV